MKKFILVYTPDSAILINTDHIIYTCVSSSNEFVEIYLPDKCVILIYNDRSSIFPIHAEICSFLIGMSSDNLIQIEGCKCVITYE